MTRRMRGRAKVFVLLLLLHGTATACTQPTCTGQPQAVWHSLSADQPFEYLAAQPEGTLVAAGSAGWQRFALGDGSPLGAWKHPAGTQVAALAVAGNGAFVLAGWVKNASWVAAFAADGKTLWTQAGPPDSVWYAALGTADGFVLAGSIASATTPNVLVERRKLDGSLVWSATLPDLAVPQNSFLSNDLDLAESATGTVLVGGTHWEVKPSEYDSTPILHAIDTAGHVDGGMRLIEETGRFRARKNCKAPWSIMRSRRSRPSPATRPSCSFAKR